MVVVWLALAAVGWLFAHAAYRTARERVYRVGWSRIITRWLLGRPWHGAPLTDAGWKREGKRALTRTGHASRFAHRPARERIAIRSGGTLAVLAAGYGLLFHRGPTLLAVKAAIVATPVLIGWAVWRKLRWRKHRRKRLYPVHHALARHVGKALPAKPESWLKIDRSLPKARWAEIGLPADFDGNPNTVKAITAAVTARLALEAPEVDQSQLVGPEPKLIIKEVEPAPKHVPLERVMPAIEAAPAHELVLGFARKEQLVKVSLTGDSPHLALSMGSGAGKSVTAELLAAQFLFKGAFGLVLDYPKMVSLPALRGLPNVAYADSAAAAHSSLEWMARELEDRAQEVKEKTDFEGVFHGHLDRMFVIAEESNALLNRLRRYWAEIRDPGDPKLSPAIDAVELASLMGRQLFIHLISIGQLLTATATGSGKDSAGRENLGVRILGRASQNNWKMMVPEHPYPGRTTRPGNVHVVTDDCRETQLAEIRHRDARRLALSGVVTPCPAGMPGRARVSTQARPPLPGPGQPCPNETPPIVSGSPPVAVSLSQALAAGLSDAPSIHALRKQAQREGWEPVGRRGLAYLYDQSVFEGKVRP